MEKIIITIDGPAGSGKTTTAREAARKLGYLYIDTGAMYRAVTLAWLRLGKAIEDTNFDDLMDSIKIELKQSDDGQKTFLNGEDVSEDIRTSLITKFSSPIAAIGTVRTKLVEQQRELGKGGGVVMDGRDIGTVVFPNADLKIFLFASIEARAERRTKELNERGEKVAIEEIKKKIIDRDYYDSHRDISPLKKADDAVEIDTSNLTIKEQTEKVVSLAEEIIKS